MTFRLTLKTPPTVEPLSVAEAKKHLNVTTFDDDAYITKLISLARFNAESVLRRSLITQTWNLYLDGFDSRITLPRPPLQTVSSVKYYDTDGNEQTLSSAVYTVDTDAEPGQVYLAYDQSWPDVRAMDKAVNIEYVAGYGAAATDVPAPVSHAMLLLISHMYEHRESVNDFPLHVSPLGFESLLWPYRVMSF